MLGVHTFIYLHKVDNRKYKSLKKKEKKKVYKLQKIPIWEE